MTDDAHRGAPPPDEVRSLRAACFEQFTSRRAHWFAVAALLRAHYAARNAERSDGHWRDMRAQATAELRSRADLVMRFTLAHPAVANALDAHCSVPVGILREGTADVHDEVSRVVPDHGVAWPQVWDELMSGATGRLIDQLRRRGD